MPLPQGQSPPVPPAPHPLGAGPGRWPDWDPQVKSETPEVVDVESLGPNIAILKSTKEIGGFQWLVLL